MYRVMDCERKMHCSYIRLLYVNDGFPGNSTGFPSQPIATGEQVSCNRLRVLRDNLEVKYHMAQ